MYNWKPSVITAPILPPKRGRHMGRDRKSILNFLLPVLILLLLLTSGCGGKKTSHLTEYQEWIDINIGLRDMVNVYTEAFFREYQRMPASLGELHSSKWFWFSPVAPDFTENFEVVDRELGSYDDDADKIQISFTETGITYVFYYRASEIAGQPHLYTGLTIGNAKSSYERNIQTDIDSAQFDVTHHGYIRQNLTYALSRLLVRRYVEAKHAPPSRPKDLLKDKWELVQDVFQSLETIPPSITHACYTGIMTVDGEAVLYVELMKPSREPFIEQRVYNIQTMNNTTAVAETFLEVTKHVEKAETKALFDSNLPGWGIL